MVTTEHMKVKVTGNEPRNYISYFQSVSTIGIINRARSAKEADAAARRKLDNSEFMCGVVNQTPFQLYATDEWTPTVASEEATSFPDGSLEIKKDSEVEVRDLNDQITVTLVGNTKQCIAEKFGKDPKSLTNDDYAKLINTMIEMGLE